MSAKQRDLVRQLSLLIQWNDSKRATTRGIPIDGQVVGVCLLALLVCAWSGSKHAARASLPRHKRTLTKFVSHALRLMRRLS